MFLREREKKSFDSTKKSKRKTAENKIVGYLLKAPEERLRRAAKKSDI
jgi:hypothetical protein